MIKKNTLFLILIFSFITINPSFGEMKSLKNKKTNVRLGPDITYPIKWYYKSKYYPVKIIDELGEEKITQLSLLSAGSNN